MADYEVMPQTAMAGGYRDAANGAHYSEKPEAMTHLRGNLLVPKDHPRILFRGRLDSLEADIIAAQLLAESRNLPVLCGELGELLALARELLGCEVKEQPIGEFSLFGLDAKGLRYASHHVTQTLGIDHPVPDYRMGAVCVALNSLRTRVRETELAAVQAGCGALVEALNRMSSGVYILFCRQLAGQEKGDTSTMNETDIRDIVTKVMEKLDSTKGIAPVATGAATIPVEASARHVHLDIATVEALFGKGVRLTNKRDLSQPGEFLCEQRVKLVTAKGQIENVAVLGPERATVQVELSMTDTRALGIAAPINLSGDLTGAGNVFLVGDKGCAEAKGSVIVAANHLHMTPADAKNYGVADRDRVNVRVQAGRTVTFENVIVRVRDTFALTMHLDFDEANACGLTCGTKGAISGRCPGITTAVPAKTAPLPKAVCTQKVITEAIARQMVAGGAKEAAFPKGILVTPSAKDVFSNAKIQIKQI